MCAGGAICGFRAFPSVSSSSDLALCLCLAFDCLLEFPFIRLFSFSFHSCYYMWVLSMHSSGGD
jgi:hypothetical protein